MSATTTNPRELTSEEVRNNLLDHFWAMVDYWNEEGRVADTREKLAGLAFSMLVVIDGESADLPAFLLAASPQPNDRLFRQGRGKNWYPEEAVNISGRLHDEWYGRDPKKEL